jgi:hypothetical protein
MVRPRSPGRLHLHTEVAENAGDGTPIPEGSAPVNDATRISHMELYHVPRVDLAVTCRFDEVKVGENGVVTLADPAGQTKRLRVDMLYRLERRLLWSGHGVDSQDFHVLPRNSRQYGDSQK